MTYDQWKTRNPTEDDDPPMRHCFACGCELGCSVEWDQLDTCGQPECVSLANDARAAARDRDQQGGRTPHEWSDVDDECPF